MSVHLHCPQCCYTFAQKLRNICPPPPSELPFVCHIPYTIGTGNIVLRPTGEADLYINIISNFTLPYSLLAHAYWRAAPARLGLTQVVHLGIVHVGISYGSYRSRVNPIACELMRIGWRRQRGLSGGGGGAVSGEG